MDLKIFEREIAALNKRFLTLCLRVPAEDELQACIHLNVEMGFVRAVRGLTLDEVESLTIGYKSLVKPAISSWELTTASKMKDHDVKTMFLFSRNS